MVLNRFSSRRTLSGALALGALLAGIVSAQGCAKGKATELPDTDPDYRYEIPTQNETEAQSLMALSRANCADAKACPEAVGMLVVATPRALGMCTGFLVSPDLIMTNSRCVGEYLDSSVRTCAGKVEVIFPESGSYPTQRAQCAEVTGVSRSDRADQTVYQDYAFIRLASPVSRAPLPLSHDGVSQNNTLRAVRMNPVSTGSYAQGELQVVKCDPLFRTWFLPQSSRADSPVFVFAGCEMVPAHAGSPLLDANGRVAAVVQTRVAKTSDAAPADMIEKPEALGLATNLACVSIPGDSSHGLSSGCGEDFSNQRASALRDQLLNGIDEVAESAIQAAMQKWTRANNLFFEWKVVRGESARPKARAVTVVPRCFHAEDEDGSWIRKYRGFFGSYKQTASVSAILPAWDLQTGFNGRQLPAYKLWPVRTNPPVRPGFELEGETGELEPMSSPAAVIDFSPYNLHHGRSTQVRTRIAGFSPAIDEISTLGFCL